MIWNRLKTVVLLASLGGLIMLLGGLMGGIGGITFAFFIALFMNGIMYFFSDKIVLALYKAQPLDQSQHARIYSMVRDLSFNMGIDMPKLWIVNTPMANAFATGRNHKNASIAITRGIANVLEPHELRGVLAHELAHIKNRDILISTIAATLATTIGYLAHMIQHLAFWQNVGDKKNRSGNPLVLLIIALLMPFAAMLIQLAISRSREFLADETGALASQDPLALASALEKLEHHIPKAHLNQEEKVYASTASLFIVHPFSGKGLISLFSTHPSMQKRVERLRNLYEKILRQ